jgi:hypothetical protein
MRLWTANAAARTRATAASTTPAVAPGEGGELVPRGFVLPVKGISPELVVGVAVGTAVPVPSTTVGAVVGLLVGAEDDLLEGGKVGGNEEGRIVVGKADFGAEVGADEEGLAALGAADFKSVGGKDMDAPLPILTLKS